MENKENSESRLQTLLIKDWFSEFSEFAKSLMTGLELATSRTQSERRIDWANLTSSSH